MSLKKSTGPSYAAYQRHILLSVCVCMLTCHSSESELGSSSVRTSTFTCGAILPAVFLFSNIGSHYITQAGQEPAR